MHRRASAIVALLAALALAACDDTVTPPTTTPTPSAVPGVSSAVYLLRGRVVAQYHRASDVALRASDVAGQWPDAQTVAAVTQELDQEGYQAGAQAEYDQPEPPPPVTPFAEIRSSAYIFGAASGAAAFFSAESTRQNQDQQGGTLSPVAGAPHDNADQLMAVEEVDAGAGAGAPQNRAYLALVRRGRVVIELFGRINQDSTTTSDFLQLLQADEATLSVQPD